MDSNRIRWAQPILAGLLLAFSGSVHAQPSNSLPHLARDHGATQIIVDGKPFLVRGGELENSSASSLSYMETVWPKIVAMRLQHSPGSGLLAVDRAAGR